MVQKEVADRLTAVPNTKSYGKLSINAQYYCTITQLFSVAPDSFYPPPTVDSTVIRLVPIQTPPLVILNKAQFRILVTLAFNQRRKTLRNALKQVITEDLWSELNIDPSHRPEQLTLSDFIRLSNLCSV
jgi:16S rRNA (adenine1518-N6/adenine1519-N6)-dimethyltransferase